MLGKEFSTQIWRISDPNTSPKIERLPLMGDSSTLDAISAQLPGGVYTTFRTYGHNKILPLEPQFCRLEESAALMDEPVSLNRDVIRQALKKALQQCQEKEIRTRLTLDLVDHPGSIYIAMETLVMPELEDYKNGVITVTKQAERDNPKAKRTSFLSSAEQMRERSSIKANEVLLVDRKGQILEGLSSNFFAVKGGVILTENEHVLSGITRSFVLEAARTAQIDVRFCALHISELGDIEEAFITSASRSVLPIQKIDQQFIGSGKPGQVTKRIMGLFQERIQRQAEEL